MQTQRNRATFSANPHLIFSNLPRAWQQRIKVTRDYKIGANIHGIIFFDEVSNVTDQDIKTINKINREYRQKK